METSLAERTRAGHAPFFDERLNARYGWEVAAYIVALAGCLALFAVVTAAVTRGRLVPGWDTRLNRWLEDNASAKWSRGFELFTHVGSFWGLLAVCALATVLLWRSRAWTDLTLLLASLAGAAVINPVAKQVIARPRPTFHDPALTLTSYSYPSGHAMGTAAVYGALAIVLARRLRGTGYVPPAVAGSALMVLLIATSRVYLGAHYISDVVGGVLLGLAWVLVCVLALTVRERRQAAG